MFRCMPHGGENQALIADGAKKVTANPCDLLSPIVAKAYRAFRTTTDELFRIKKSPH